MFNLTYSIADQEFRGAASLGIFNISMGLLNELAAHPELDHITILANHTHAGQLPASSNVSIQEFNRPIASTGQRVLWDQVGVYRAARASGSQWLFLPKGYASAVTRCPLKLAVYLHDIMPVFLADRYPGKSSRAKQTYFQYIYRATLRQADVIFTNTAYTRQDIQQWSAAQGIACPPVIVAGYGFPKELNPPPDHTQRRNQVLFFIRTPPYKRTERALEYLERWRQETGYKGTILCVGDALPTMNIPDNPQWKQTGRVSPDRVADLLAESNVALHFSEYEGFGMPPVEATLAHCAAVFSDCPPTMEAMGHCGFPFSNTDYASFARAMDNAFKAPETQIAEWANELRNRHRWSNVAETVVSTLRNHDTT